MQHSSWTARETSERRYVLPDSLDLITKSFAKGDTFFKLKSHFKCRLRLGYVVDTNLPIFVSCNIAYGPFNCQFGMQGIKKCGLFGCTQFSGPGQGFVCFFTEGHRGSLMGLMIQRPYAKGCRSFS